MLYRWFFRRSTLNKDTGVLTLYADDDETALATMTTADDGTTQTKGVAE
jgi:hypothetical protein